MNDSDNIITDCRKLQVSFMEHFPLQVFFSYHNRLTKHITFDNDYKKNITTITHYPSVIYNNSR